MLEKISSGSAAVLLAVRDLLVPPACIACDAPTSRQGGLCAACWSRARFIERPYCEQLGTPFAVDQGEGALSAEAIANPPPFDRLRSALVYDDCARLLVTGLKFSDRPELARWMAQRMIIAGRELLADRPLIVPAPLHWRRLHERRYNQSAELARAIARHCGLEYAPQALTRHRATRQQIGLTSGERERNVQGAFRVEPENRPKVEGRRILLVDDVYTSGSTIKACARALRRAGAAAIDALTFARVLNGDI